jgi:hypothetical protein
MTRMGANTHPKCVVFFTMGAGVPVYTHAQQHPPRISSDLRTMGGYFFPGAES